MSDLEEIERLVETYRSWLKDKTTLKLVHSDWIEITTPFLDRHNDAIQIYAKSENGGYRLTDDGNTIRDLELSGCILNTTTRQKFLSLAINGFAVEFANGVLSVLATRDNFAYRKHDLIQCILAVNDLFYMASSTVRSLFREDVQMWLKSKEIRFLENVQFSGKSGYSHQFDFAIPSTADAPERILRAINNPNKSAAENFIFAWLDTRDNRPSDSLAIAMLNDNDREIPASVLDAMRRYQIESVLWSKRNENLLKLAA